MKTVLLNAKEFVEAKAYTWVDRGDGRWSALILRFEDTEVRIEGDLSDVLDLRVGCMDETEDVFDFDESGARVRRGHPTPKRRLPLRPPGASD